MQQGKELKEMSSTPDSNTAATCPVASVGITGGPLRLSQLQLTCWDGSTAHCWPWTPPRRGAPRSTNGGNGCMPSTNSPQLGGPEVVGRLVHGFRRGSCFIWKLCAAWESGPDLGQQPCG